MQNIFNFFSSFYKKYLKKKFSEKKLCFVFTTRTKKDLFLRTELFQIKKTFLINI